MNMARMQRMPPIPELPAWRRNDPVDVVIALGANLGDTITAIEAAAARLERLPLTSDVQLSSIYSSVALTLDGPDPDRPTYANAVALAKTRLSARMLLDFLHAIEADLGRERGERWGDRTIDLDLIKYGELVSTDASLMVPHPRAHERDFVLVPWLELDPDAELPQRGRVDELVGELAEVLLGEEDDFTHSHGADTLEGEE